MQPTPMLSALTEHWNDKGWSLASLAQFRMEDGPTGSTGSTGSTGGTGATGGTGPTGSTGSAENEPLFPPHTPASEMTPGQQVEYWKHQSRKHEARATARGDYDDIKAKADQYDALAAASQTEQERAIATARDEEATKIRSEERAKHAPLLVDAEMRAAAAGRLTPEQLAPVLEPIDRSKFLTDTGEVDLEKVATFINSVAPAATGGNGARPFPNLGQGQHNSGGKPSVSSGAERYAAKHPKKT